VSQKCSNFATILSIIFKLRLGLRLNPSASPVKKVSNPKMLLPSLHHFRRGGRLLLPGLSMTIDILISQGQIQALS
jgi:hypothetical protein